MPRHLLALRTMSRDDLTGLIERAANYRTAGAKSEQPLGGLVVANVFFEPSTRTRASFEVAAAHSGAHVLNWTVQGSSASKGESLIDTVKNIAALGPAVMVIRHFASGAAELVARQVKCAIVNAGDGCHEHPSQGLLDAFTLVRRWGSLVGKRVLIVGDILHSRVARSNIYALRTLGAQVSVAGPPWLLPQWIAGMGVDICRGGDAAQTHALFEAALEQADAVMMLRVQRERQQGSDFPSAEAYHQLWGLTRERARRLKAETVILHPGPVNRGLELAPDVADSHRSIILEQVENGVAMRRAILEWTL